MPVMIRILGCVLVIGSAAGIGCLCAKRVYMRMEELKALHSCFLLLRGRISYSGATLPEALHGIHVERYGLCGAFLNRVRNDAQTADGECFHKIWDRAIREELKESALSKTDKCQLAELGPVLGQADEKLLCGMLSAYEEQLALQLSELRGQVDRKAGLYRKLGAMSGIFLTVLLV